MKSPEKISLCLSGGGLRATFFHLGTVLALRDAGLLDRVNNIYSVSGGSISAAQIALNWNGYNGTEEEKIKAATHLINVREMDIRGRVFRRQLLSIIFFSPLFLFSEPKGLWKLARAPEKWSGTKILLDEYKKLLGNVSLAHLRGVGIPKIHLLATSLTSAKLAVFTDEGLTIGEAKFAGEEIPVALAVAASSAFPPLFPPVALNRKRFAANRDQFAAENEFLSDGGVFDNLGCFIPLSNKSKDFIILSDASASIDKIYDRHFSSILNRNLRSTDIVMERLSEETLNTLRLREGFTHVKIGNLAGPQNVDLKSPMYIAPETHAATAAIRTDLDVFSKKEVKALVINGYINCSQALEFQFTQDNLDNLTFIGIESVKLDDLNFSSERRYTYFNKNDVYSYFLSVILVLIRICLVFAGISIAIKYTM